MTISAETNPQDDGRLSEIEELRQQMDQSEGRRIHAHLSSYLRTVNVWQGFANNLLALLHECEHNDQMRVYAMTSFKRDDPRDSIISTLDSSLVAYAAGVGAVIDQTREVISKHGDDKIKAEFEQRKKNLEELVPSAPFLVKLRNYVLHYLSAPWELSLRWVNEDEVQTVTFKVQLGRDQLLELKGWSRPAKAFLEQQESGIHITPLIEAFTDSEMQLSAWVHDSIVELRAPEIDATNDLIRRYNLALTDGAHDGSDWDEVEEQMNENVCRVKEGDPQVDWRDVNGYDR